MLDDVQNIVLTSEESDRELRYSVRDLELMHKFATESYKSLCGDQSDAQAWQCLIPQHAYSHEYLLHGILALAALHVAATSPDREKALSYLDTAVQYSSLSFGPYREALNHLTPQTCEAVFASSAIVMVISIALPCLSAEYRDEKLIMFETMTAAWELFQGGRSISYISEPWLRGAIFSNYNFWEMQTAPLDPGTTAALDQLDELNYHAVESHTGTWDSNRATIELLRSCFSRFANSPHPAAILGWLAYVQKKFVDRLCSRQPFQLLIFMHWGVLLNELGRQFWWARGSGKALVAELSEELESLAEDPRWSRALQWPQSQISS